MKSIYRRMVFVIFMLLFIPAGYGVFAQEATPEAFDPVNLLVTTPPPAYQLQGFRHEYQGWNNCGPATLTAGLTHFGYADNQNTAAAWLKPNYEDKNVSPWQMVEFVNTQVPGTTQARWRYGGSLDTLKLFIANGFPVIIEAGYDPEPERLGWMGHYLLVTGYDDASQTITTQDSYLGPNKQYTYEEINTFWHHFNRVYIVLYDFSREAEVTALLGSDADEQQNYLNALTIARTELQTDATDAFSWFNMGTSFVGLGMYEEAAVAYDQARANGLPWRMLWYQFGPFEAYYHVGRYQDMLTLAAANLNDGGGQYVEETFYYAGLAREGLGENDRALTNLNTAIQFNPNFTPARTAIDQLQTALTDTTANG